MRSWRNGSGGAVDPACCALSSNPLALTVTVILGLMSVKPVLLSPTSTFDTATFFLPRGAVAARRIYCKKTRLVFEFPLRLSRACLGKTIIFVCKWLKKCRVLHLRRPQRWHVCFDDEPAQHHLVAFNFISRSAAPSSCTRSPRSPGLVPWEVRSVPYGNATLF